MPQNVDFHLLLSAGSIAVNLLLTVVMLRVKVELAEIKVWILENFERRNTSNG